MSTVKVRNWLIVVYAMIAATVLIGGKLNQIATDSNSSLPVDVTADLAAEGAVVCRSPETLLQQLLALAEARNP